MSSEHPYAMYATRLASFATSIPAPSKKSTSNAKSSKSITWPHKNPSPEELAKAGFYYKPSAEAPDNTVCYMCERQLDGWEKEDSPVEEHVKHSGQCGWAILMEIMKETPNVSNMEDPTLSRLSDARAASFESGWPHEAKRGWVCKIERMVQAGWHFAPTPESDDFVSCAYCKLSLDGWEPKDNPFDEHHRRSPDCPFFSFAGATAPKAGKGKKGRASKASRESTITVASEVPSIPDLNESIDTSTVSVLSTASTMGRGKNARGKAKAARHNKAEEAWGLQPEQSVIIIDNDPEPVKPARGRKRASEQISQDRDDREDTAKPEPPAKRRNTRTRDSVAQVKYPTLEAEPEAMEVDTVAQKPAKNGRKRASTTTRSRRNTGASIASLRAAVPNIAAIEAALAAELDTPLSDEDIAPESEKPKRGRAKKATASKAHVRGKKVVSPEPEPQTEDLKEAVIELEVAEEVLPKNARKTKATKKTTQKRESHESTATGATNLDTAVESSIVTAQTIDDSGHETDASAAGGPRAKKGGKKKATKAKSRKAMASKNIEDIVQKPEQAVDAANVMDTAEEAMNVSAEIAVLNAEIEKEEQAAAINKPAKKGTKGKKAAKAGIAERAPHLSMPGAFSPIEFREETMDPSFMSAVASDTPPMRIARTPRHEAQEEHMIILPAEKVLTPTPTPRAVPPIPPRSPARTATPGSAFRAPVSVPRATPGSQLAAELEASVLSNSSSPASPQEGHSSDVENAPPSSRPASVRPPLGDVAVTRVAFNFNGPGTPSNRVPVSPSKIGGGIQSEVVWDSVDVDMIFQNENNTPGREDLIQQWVAREGLNEEEKGMTVQEWIYANATKAEEALKAEAERVVGVFEREGGRAMRVLEGVVVV